MHIAVAPSRGEKKFKNHDRFSPITQYPAFRYSQVLIIAISCSQNIFPLNMRASTKMSQSSKGLVPSNYAYVQGCSGRDPYNGC